jgi:phage N-6-adenine-methyltransferase
MNTELMFSSATDLWSTPKDFFHKLDAEFHFKIDVCANDDNAKCAWFLSEADDALSWDWGKVACWMNPPYGREIGKWVQKAYESAQKGATVVCLLPSRTDTRWWHDYCVKGEIRFIRGRLKFGCQKNSAPFPSAVVIFRPTATPESEAKS